MCGHIYGHIKIGASLELSDMVKQNILRFFDFLK